MMGQRCIQTRICEWHNSAIMPLERMAFHGADLHFEGF
jgi:hypothetical protein